MPTCSVAFGVPRGLRCVVLCALVAISVSCPDLAALRSSRVASNFDAADLTGYWYEQAFIDPAQLAASCQTLNTTL